MAATVSAAPTGDTYALLSDADSMSGQVGAGTWAPEPPPGCWPVKKKIWKKVWKRGHWIWTWSWSETKHYKKIVYGTPGDDVIYGGNQAQIIMGLGGDDKLFGGNSGDCLVGGPGRDWLFGGNAKDILIGGGDDDFLNGGNGKDWLEGLGQWLDDLGDLNECVGGRGVDQVVNCLLEGEIETALMEQNAVLEDPMESTVRQLQNTDQQAPPSTPEEGSAPGPLPEEPPAEEQQKVDEPKVPAPAPAPPTKTEEPAPPTPSPTGTTPPGETPDATCTDPAVGSENCEVTP